GLDRGYVELRPADVEYDLVHAADGGLEALRAAPCRPQRGQRDPPEGTRGRALAHRVGDGDPGAVPVLDVVEPVAANLVRGQDAAGDLAAAEPGDPGRQQALLQ